MNDWAKMAIVGMASVAVSAAVMTLRAPPAPKPTYGAIPAASEEPCHTWCRMHDGGASCIGVMEFKDARRPPGTQSICR